MISFGHCLGHLVTLPKPEDLIWAMRQESVGGGQPTQSWNDLNEVAIWVSLLDELVARHFGKISCVDSSVAMGGDWGGCLTKHAFWSPMGHPTHVHTVDLLDLFHIENRLMM